jgi:purine-binding chemotaxis protein CheW
MDADLVPVGDDLYGVPIGWVREVLAAPPLTRLVTAPPLVLGLFNLRGEIVPLMDTAAMLGLRGVAPAAFAVVLQTHLGPFGMSATAFPRRVLLEDFLGPSELACGAGTYRVGSQVAVMLDIEAVLDSVTLPGLVHPDDLDHRAAALVRRD